jgi:hypothetical protein
VEKLLVISIIFSITCYSVIYFTFIQLKRLYREVELIKSSGYIGTHPSIGYKIEKDFPIPIELQNSYFILIISDPGCSICYSQLEEFMELNSKYQYVPSLILAINDKNLNLFKEKYSDSFLIEVVERDSIIEKLHIDGFPSYALINRDLKIVKYFDSAKHSYNEYYDNFRQKKEEVVV